MTKSKDKKSDNSINITRYNIDKLKNSILINANQMISLNGKIDTFKLVDKATIVNNPIMQYEDAEGNNINEDKTQKYWLNEIERYIRYLLRVNDEDISNVSADELKQKAVDFNIKFIDTYISGIKNYAVDLIDTKEIYASHLATALADLQAMEISKIGIIGFNLLDLKNDINTIKQYMGINRLLEVQDTFRKLYPNPSTEDATDSGDLNIIKSVLYQHQLLDSLEQVQKIIDDNKAYYDKLHQKHNKINKLIAEIGKKFKARDDELNSISTQLEVIDNKDIVVKKDNIKIPTTYTYDFDIMRLFNNIYPNFKFKSIDEDRHKDLDIKAKLMLDIESDTTDANILFQNMRLIEFIKSGNIALYPIQSALINGFIDVRDNQDTIDKVIPFQSTLKYITEDKKLRFPKSKKDIQLYEDFMLFFDRCKIQVKIIDRATNSTIFEVMQPIPLLSNTQAYSNNSGMGYIIGNSIINILKNELDNIHITPHQTTLKDSKGYLLSKLPKTPPTINLTQYMYGKVAQMINSYNKRGTYNGKVNIQPLYDFQAFYNKHSKPTKDDNKKVREMLNKYLDELISKGLISSYSAINDKKEITQYKIEINKKAKL